MSSFFFFIVYTFKNIIIFSICCIAETQLFDLYVAEENNCNSILFGLLSVLCWPRCCYFGYIHCNAMSSWYQYNSFLFFNLSHLSIPLTFVYENCQITKQFSHVRRLKIFPPWNVFGNCHSPAINIKFSLRDKVEFWSCDCIVKETVWNRSEKVDHLAYKYWCVL